MAVEANKEVFLVNVYPNPFSDLVTINYILKSTQNITIRILDINGKEIDQLITGIHSAGKHEIVWDGTNFNGVPVNPGNYILYLEAGPYNETKKIIKE